MRFATVILLLFVASATFAAYPQYGGYNYNGYGGHYNGDANTDAILMDNIKSKCRRVYAMESDNSLQR